MLKVLHVINNLDTGGAERLLADMLPLFAARGISASVLVLGLGDRTIYESLMAKGVDVSVSPVGSIYSPAQIGAIRDLVKTNQIDIVHVHLFPAMYWVSIAAFKFRDVPIVVTEHNTWNGRRRSWLRPLERFVYSRYTKIVCVSDQASEALRSWHPTVSGREFIINNGIDSAAFKPKRVEAHEERYSVITVGRLTKQKAVDVIIRAVAACPVVTACIVGDGPLRPSLEDLAKDLAVQDRVHFLGTRTDVPDLLRSAAIYVQASLWEGFGIAALEAMSAGLPLLISDVPGLSEMAGDAGFRFKPGSHQELAAGLRRLLDDHELRQALGAKGRTRAERFSISRTVDRHVELYRSIEARRSWLGSQLAGLGSRPTRST